MAKEIAYSADAQQRILRGINQVADAVKRTLGPMGRNTVLSQANVAPMVSNNGFSITKQLELEDAFEAIGANVMRQVAERVHDAVGDGATTAIVLAQRMIQDGFGMIAAGANPMEMKKGMQGAAQLAAAAMKRIAIPVTGHAAIVHIASIAAGNNEVGELIADAMERVSADGTITVEESSHGDMTLDVMEGMQFERGYLAPEMVTDREQMTAELYNPYILVTDRKIDRAQDLLPLLEVIRSQGRPLLILAEGVEGDALATLLINKERGLFSAVAVHPPAYGEGRRARMEDIALLTGATFLTQETGYCLEDATPEQLGQAAFVKVTKNSTVITGGAGDKAAIVQRIQSLRAMLQKAEYDFDRKQLEERLAKLSSGVAVIRVGAATQTEALERKQWVEAALHASRAAVEEGVVPGGGAAYFRTLPAVAAYAETLHGDRKIGAEIVLRALEAPACQIAANAGIEAGTVAAKLKSTQAEVGLDAVLGKCVNLLDAGIVDSAKVVRVALQCAASMASVLLTTEAGVCESRDMNNL